MVLVNSPSEPAGGKSSEPMQFNDSTDFTVAGITDWTAAGGHGSDVNLRTSEALAKETRELSGEESNQSAPRKPSDSRELLTRRDQLRKQLGSEDRAN